MAKPRFKINLDDFTTHATLLQEAEEPQLLAKIERIKEDAVQEAKDLSTAQIRERLGIMFGGRSAKTKGELVADYARDQVERSEPHRRLALLNEAALADREMARQLNAMAAASGVPLAALAEIDIPGDGRARLQAIRAQVADSYAVELERLAVMTLRDIGESGDVFRVVLNRAMGRAVHTVLAFIDVTAASGFGGNRMQVRNFAEARAARHLLQEVVAVYQHDETMRLDMSMAAIVGIVE